MLLQANFNGQGSGANSLGIDHVSDEVVLGRSVDVCTLGGDGLLTPCATSRRTCSIGIEPGAPSVGSKFAPDARRRLSD